MPTVRVRPLYGNISSGQLGNRLVRTGLTREGTLEVSIWDGPHWLGCGTLIGDGTTWHGVVSVQGDHWSVTSRIGSSVFEFKEDGEINHGKG